jgi:hypothetical protein
MAHLWLRENDETSPNDWGVMPLEEGAAAFGPALLLRCQDASGDLWLLMDAAPPRVRLNGASLITGIHVLQDRDEITIPGVGRMFFSTEVLARVEPYPGGERPAICPRCKRRIDTATPAVRCPQCGVWHHQSDELPCWTYSDTCALCSQPTALDAGYRWTPEAL